MNQFQIICTDESATAQLAETIALALRPGDLVTLTGDLGAGKTTLARALIRTASGDPLVEVPSPTFTLVQVYDDLPFGRLAHMDLYRIEDGSELEELGLDEVLLEGVALIEWPQKARDALPPASLAIAIEQGGHDDERVFSLSGESVVMERVKRSLAIREFLDAHGHQDSRRQHLTGDASTRAYETIHPVSGQDVILMNAPAQPDGPPIRDGKPYSRIANLAEDMSAFVGVALTLEGHGFRTPKILAHDLDQGLLLIENLGVGSIITGDREPIEERYLASVEALAAIHETSWNAACALPDGGTHIIPPFDREAMLIEVDLLAKWYAPYRLKRPLQDDEQARFDAIWNDLITKLETCEISIVLRDFHSPNIIWNDNASGIDRIGLIDFQDALIGPAAYDVASIAQDARIDISADLEARLVDHYCASRSNLDHDSFRAAYAIMAAERATKVLGIFVRLSQRDGKHGYLAHLPRIETYLARSLSHPALADYRTWVETALHL